MGRYETWRSGHTIPAVSGPNNESLHFITSADAAMVKRDWWFSNKNPCGRRIIASLLRWWLQKIRTSKKEKRLCTLSRFFFFCSFYFRKSTLQNTLLVASPEFEDIGGACMWCLTRAWRADQRMNAGTYCSFVSCPICTSVSLISAEVIIRDRTRTPGLTWVQTWEV